MKLTLYPLFLALATFTFLSVSCTKDKDLTTEIEGAYVGPYEDINGGITLYDVKIEVTKVSNSEISCEIFWIGSSLGSFPGEMEDKTHFTFSSDNGTFGTGLLENGKTLIMDFEDETDPDSKQHYEGERQ